MIKVILFDLGGVLAELRGEAHMLSLLDGRMDRAEMWRHWGESPAVRAHETGKMSAEEFADAIVDELALPIGADEFLRGFRDWIVGPYAETPALIREVAARHTTALLTNTSAVHWPIIETLNVLPHMHHVIASYQIGKIKPDRDFFDAALQRVNALPHETIFFDDSAANVAAAQALGIEAHRVDGAANVRRVLIQRGLL